MRDNQLQALGKSLAGQLCIRNFDLAHDATITAGLCSTLSNTAGHIAHMAGLQRIYGLYTNLFSTAVLLLLSLFPTLAKAQAQTDTASLVPVELRVSGLKEPVGLEEQQPSFGWQLDAGAPNRHDVSQSAYRILVASSDASLRTGKGDVWDSGRMQSRDYTHVEYAGLPLQSHTTYFWKVCVWDDNGRAACSAPSRWITALLHHEDWVAKWVASQPDGPLEPQAREGIGKRQATPEALPIFRHSFHLAKPVEQAIVYVSGLGQYELHVNGQPITDAVMTPGWTNYRKTVLYNTFDVTGQIKRGENILGVTAVRL
jgi:alpha-L-rhamnosidase